MTGDEVKEKAVHRAAVKTGVFVDVMQCAIDAYEAALWQPIETMPLGNPVIVTWEHGGMCLVSVDTFDDFDDSPTHWRPLPAPPETNHD